MAFVKAEKKNTKLRIALIGPSGSGKTFSALSVASHLGGKIAVIDTERGSASAYADKFNFNVMELDTFEPGTYVSAMDDAARSGHDILIIDSLSHAWMGKGGALEMVENAKARSKTQNSFTAWREVTPEHNALVNAILTYPGHVFATVRAKTEYVMEKDEKGRTVPRKVGMAPIQRDGLEYEFFVVGDMDQDNNLVISKTRIDSLKRKVFKEPGKDFADILTEWLSGNPKTETVIGLTDGKLAWELEGSLLIEQMKLINGQDNFTLWKNENKRRMEALRAQPDVFAKVVEAGKETAKRINENKEAA